jgi:hypothetical protein
MPPTIYRMSAHNLNTADPQVASADSQNRHSEPPISKPAEENRRTTAEDLESFKNPENLYGKRFMVSPDAVTDDSTAYEVIGYYKGRGGTIRYDVLFEDCEDIIAMEDEEMMSLLGDSLVLPA